MNGGDESEGHFRAKDRTVCSLTTALGFECLFETYDSKDYVCRRHVLARDNPARQSLGQIEPCTRAVECRRDKS